MYNDEPTNVQQLQHTEDEIDIEIINTHPLSGEPTQTDGNNCYRYKLFSYVLNGGPCSHDVVPLYIHIATIYPLNIVTHFRKLYFFFVHCVEFIIFLI